MKGILELIKLIYGSKALSKILGTRTNVIRLPDNELKQYTKSDLNIEAASDKLAQKAKADMKELLADYPRMNDAEKLIFEGNLRRLGNKLGVTEKGPAADVLEFGTGEKVSPEGIMSLTEKAGQKSPPTTLMGKLESRIKQLEASGEDLSKLKGKTYDEFMKDITQGQKSMRKLEDEGLVRATAREIIGRDIKSGKIKLPKEIEQDIVQGGGEPINVFRQFYGEDALEQLDSMIPEFKNMYSPREAADAATKKFKFEFKADRPPGSISIEDAKKAEQEFRINKPKQNEVTDITAKVYRNADPDELIGEYNKNLDLLSQVDEEGGTLIGYEQFKKLQNRNTEIEKILNSIGIKSADSPEGKKITEALIGKPKASVTELVTAEKIISDMKNMDPMDAMKEANKVLKKEGKYKNLQEKDVERIMEDTNDYIFGRDIPEDPEGFAKGGRVGMAGERQGYADGDIASGLAIRLNRPVQPGDPIGSYYGGTPIMISNKKVEPTLNRDSQGRLVNSITGKPITTPIFLPLNRELMSSPSKPSMTLRDKLRPLSLNERLQFFATNKPSYDEFYDLLQMNLKGEDRQQAADGGSQGLDYLMGIERRGYANGDYVVQAGIKNYLGKQKTATVPIKWKSGKGDSHPDTELAYITKPEKDLLIKLDMHNSMPDGEPNIGPGGLISLNSGGDGGAGGGGGGDGGADASSPGDTGGAGGADGAGGNDAGGASGGSGSIWKLILVLEQLEELVEILVIQVQKLVAEHQAEE
jgi:DNA-directed RNA polymerase subunit N (RpoN/RPB10)